MAKPAPIRPLVRRVMPGDQLRLCHCGQSATLPDCPAACPQSLQIDVQREQLLLLCHCGLSLNLPYCDGRHAGSGQSLAERWRRFRHD
jgi:CDGSH-type Zn-finger protein